MALELSKRKPKDIVFGDDLTIEWKDGAISHFPLFGLRDACPCAACVEEMTGRKMLDPKSIPPDIHIKKCEYVGNYAIRIDWSDGHNSGIYSFRFLRELAELKNLPSVAPAAN
jgi:ATP-binding protein involved in chromosome partitioning